MIRPLRACRADCHGWSLLSVRGWPLLAAACRACWAGEILAPTPAYYRSQLEPRKAMDRALRAVCQGVKARP